MSVNSAQCSCSNRAAECAHDEFSELRTINCPQRRAHPSRRKPPNHGTSTRAAAGSTGQVTGSGAMNSPSAYPVTSGAEIVILSTER